MSTKTRKAPSSTALPTPTDRPALTAREARVALGVARGETYQEISEKTDIVFETVRSIVDRLRDKTGHRRKPQLAVWAVEQLDWLVRVVQAQDAKER